METLKTLRIKLVALSKFQAHLCPIHRLSKAKYTIMNTLKMMKKNFMIFDVNNQQNNQ